MPRLFIAIDLPEVVKAQLTALCSGFPGARWVPPEQRHLTLRFIGDADDRQLAQLQVRLAAISLPRFCLSLQKTGCFPSARQPRVLWIGIQKVAALFQLVTDIEQAVAATGFPTEHRPYTPHITLARLKDSQPEDFAAYQAKHADLPPTPFAVNEFHLYASILTRDGAIHRRKGTFPLTIDGGT